MAKYQLKSIVSPQPKEQSVPVISLDLPQSDGSPPQSNRHSHLIVIIHVYYHY